MVFKCVLHTLEFVVSTVKKKRELFPGFSLTLWRLIYVAMFWSKCPSIGKGILTFFPFDKQGGVFFYYSTRLFKTELPYLLGSTDSWPITVVMKPFSTSVFKSFFSFEYLLLPPRSTLLSVSSAFTRSRLCHWQHVLLLNLHVIRILQIGRV